TARLTGGYGGLGAAAGARGLRGRLVVCADVHRVRGRARAGVLVVLHRERDGVRARRGVGVRRILLRGRLAVPEGPTPARDRAVGITALIGEGAGEPGAARGERRGGRLVGRADVHRLRGRAIGGALVVLDRERDSVGATRRIRVGRILLRGRLAVPEVPTPACDRAVGITALIGEGAGEPGAARGERRGGRLVGRADVHRLRGRARAGGRK